MQIISVFDDCSSRPLVTAIFDGNLEVIPLYIKGTKRSLFDVQRDVDLIAKRASESDHIILNDAKSHFTTFNIKSDQAYQADVSLPRRLTYNQYVMLFKSMFPLKVEKDHWRKLIADASKAYLTMESRPIYLDEMRVFPRYSITTFSGRSKCTGFNLQGASEGTPVKTKDGEFFVCLDWTAADLRVAAAMSNDEELEALFEESDPYSSLAETLKITRQDCKRMMLRTLYALDLESPLLDLFKKLKSWVVERLAFMKENGYLPSLLGRRFKLKARDQRSVFNATLQGTVAHALHSALAQIDSRLGRFLLTERHDSIVFACNAAILPKVLRESVEIMKKPLEGLPTMPLKVYIGKEWKRWKFYKAFK